MPSVSEDPAKQAIWEIESTHPELAPKVEEALREVLDPELGLNIIELGLVRNVSYTPEEKKAHIKMIMTTPFCPYAPALLEMTKDKVSETLDLEATIEMGMEPWDFSFMEEGLGADWGMF
jgi:metal-sulfur cluster biosynthetic enzyme